MLFVDERYMVRENDSCKSNGNTRPGSGGSRNRKDKEIEKPEGEPQDDSKLKETAEEHIDLSDRDEATEAKGIDTDGHDTEDQTHGLLWIRRNDSAESYPMPLANRHTRSLRICEGIVAALVALCWVFLLCFFFRLSDSYLFTTVR